MAGGFLSRLKGSLGGGEKGEALPLNLWGKLPIYKDFISAGLTDDASREFKEWISNGFSRLWSTNDELREEEIGFHSFVLNMPRAARTVAGCLWGSHDEGGLRRFPFSVFAVLPLGRHFSDPVCALEALEVVEEKASAIRRNWDSPGTLTPFYAAFRGATMEIPQRPREKVVSAVAVEAAAVPAAEFALAFLGGDGRAFASYLAATEAALGPVGAEEALRLPLVDLLPPARQAQLWLLRAGGSARVPEGILLGTPGVSRAEATFLYRPVRPEDFLLLRAGPVPEAPPPIPEGDGNADAEEGGDVPPPERTLRDVFLGSNGNKA